MAVTQITIDEKKGTFTITGDVDDDVVSKTGKMNLLATTRGNAPTTANYKGKQVFLNLNMGTYVGAKPAADKAKAGK